MEKWDAQMMLDLYIHNYMIKKNMHTTAETFAREANFHPTEVAIENPEGFLYEWWSVFWSIFSARYPEHTVQEHGDGPSDFNPAMPSPDVIHMLQNMPPTMPPGFPDLMGPSTMQTQDMQNMFNCDNSNMMIQGPGNGGFLPNDLSRPTMGRPEDLNLLGSNISRAVMARPEPGIDITAADSNSPLMNVDQLVRSLPSSSNPRYQQEKVYINPPPCPRRNENCRSGSRRSTAAAGPSNPSSEPQDRKFKAPETESKDPAKNMNFSSQLDDPIARLMQSSMNFSHSPQEKVHTKPHQQSLGNDDKSSTRFCPLTAAEAARFPPIACPPRMETAVADARIMYGPGFSGFHSIDPSTKPLPSGSNMGGPKKIRKQRQTVTGAKRYGAGLKRSEPSQLPPRAILPKPEPADDARRAYEQAPLGPPPGMELPVLPSSPRRHSSPPQNVSKNDKLPVTHEGNGCDRNLKRETDAEPEPTHPAPKAAIQPKIEPAETGSDTSSSSES